MLGIEVKDEILVQETRVVLKGERDLAQKMPRGYIWAEQELEEELTVGFHITVQADPELVKDACDTNIWVPLILTRLGSAAIIIFLGRNQSATMLPASGWTIAFLFSRLSQRSWEEKEWFS